MNANKYTHVKGVTYKEILNGAVDMDTKYNALVDESDVFLKKAGIELNIDDDGAVQVSSPIDDFLEKGDNIALFASSLGKQSKSDLAQSYGFIPHYTYDPMTLEKPHIVVINKKAHEALPAAIDST